MSRGTLEASFNIDELEDYEKYLVNLVEEKMPSETTKFMRKQASDFKNLVKKNAKTNVNKKSGAYLQGWKKGRIYEYRGVKYNVRVYNNNPIAHLVEYGHIIRNKSDGPDLGYVKGKFVLEKSTKEFEKKFHDKVFDFIDNMLDKGLQ